MQTETSDPKIEVFIRCPTHQKDFSILLEASTSEEAIAKILGKTVECPYKPFHKFIVTYEHIVAARVPPKLKELVTAPVKAPKPPLAEIEAPTVLASTTRIDGVAMKLQRGRETLGITIPQSEAETFERLMKTARAAGQATLINGILAFLIAHGGGTKTMITGFLQVSGFPEATPSSVGEALSRLASEGIIYKYPATFIFTRYPLGIYGRREKIITSEVLGEPVYGISEATRIRILERLKLEPHLPWWKTETLKPPPPTLPAIKKPVEYEWIKIIKPIPKLRAEEDFKQYGPYTPEETAKLPIALAYFLVHKGYAEWLNPRKETVKQAEEIFKFQPIEKIKRQATLTEF